MHTSSIASRLLWPPQTNKKKYILTTLLFETRNKARAFCHNAFQPQNFQFKINFSVWQDTSAKMNPIKDVIHTHTHTHIVSFYRRITLFPIFYSQRIFMRKQCRCDVFLFFFLRWFQLVSKIHSPELAPSIETFTHFAHTRSKSRPEIRIRFLYIQCGRPQRT